MCMYVLCKFIHMIVETHGRQRHQKLKLELLVLVSYLNSLLVIELYSSGSVLHAFIHCEYDVLRSKEIKSYFSFHKYNCLYDMNKIFLCLLDHGKYLTRNFKRRLHFHFPTVIEGREIYLLLLPKYWA